MSDLRARIDGLEGDAQEQEEQAYELDHTARARKMPSPRHLPERCRSINRQAPGSGVPVSGSLTDPLAGVAFFINLPTAIAASSNTTGSMGCRYLRLECV